jgi:hypothetical protein
VRDVISAADEPSPVLCTSESRMPVGVNGGICESACRVLGKPSCAS